MLKLNNRYSLDKITLTPIILFETCKQFFSSTFSKAQRNPGDFDSAVLSEKIMLLLFFVSCFCHTSFSSLHCCPFLIFYLIAVGGACSVLCICLHVQLNVL